ncbi:uncharacterized protein LOC144558502 [Carex rostrata]
MGAKDNGNEIEDYSAEQGKEAELDIEPARDSFSSQHETHLIEENNKAKRVTRVPKKITKKETIDSNRSSRISRLSTPKLQYNKTSSNNNKSTPKNSPKQLNVSNNNHVTRNSNGKKTETETKEVLDEAVQFVTMDEGKEVVDVLDEAPNCDQSNSTDTETPDREEEPLVAPEEKINDIIYRKMEELEVKVEKFEDELREVAAIEFSIYSVVAEHASSGYEVHTPARRLSKVFIHAFENFPQDKKANMARSIVSGLVNVAKSCGNDISRLTFWLSNTIVLREIITQNLAKSSQRSRVIKEIAADAKVPSFQWRNGSISRPDRTRTSIQPTYVWHETSTIMTALKKIESWIFNRIVESVWWQALTPYMQSPIQNTHLPISLVRLLEQYSGDRKQGNISVNLWTMAFHDAFTKLCPLRAGGSKCGCLPALTKLVMEHCIARLDVAMFNAILREPASDIPTDPISDPIAEPKVLPISPRDLSFGTGAQLRNAIGNWSILLTEKFGMDAEESRKGVQDGLEDDDDRNNTNEIMWFGLLRELSELLMLPKDMLLETPIRQEVCPSFGLPLITRILGNFTPDELCPDPVPSFVLDELNSESLLDEESDKEKVISIPCAAPAMAYNFSTPANVTVKLAIAEEATSKLDKKVLSVQRRGYTSQDDLRELDLPLLSLDDKSVTEMSQTNERYKLQEIWYE